MAKKKKVETTPRELAPIVDQNITETLEKNYMPYSMSVIISRAIPEIDGFKPSHRKLLYTMYNMGLLNGNRTKSANVVGQTMRLNPHGDMAIYETMVRLTRGNEALLHAFIDSKGSFGKQYSKMAFAASRYTEVKLAEISAELFAGIDKDAVDFTDNYDNTMKEPILFPVTFPNVLVTPNTGIAVGMASSICSFNLGEICDTTIAYIRDNNCDISATLPAPDFSTGGYILYDKEQMDSIYQTGRGSFKVRSKYTFNKEANCIEITEIPYSTNIETIIDKMSDLVKANRLREVSDVRDETDLNGLKIAIDVKRGTDIEKLMAKLFKYTTLEDDFACNFNILIGSRPFVLGIRRILEEWLAFRSECLKREIYFDLEQKSKRLHLLEGLEKLLLDIDKAIKIIRRTENDRDVVPNLAKGFDIDELQAEFIANIKLRNLNKEYIIGKVSDIERLKGEIAELEGILASPRRLGNLIVKQLTAIKAKYAIERKSKILPIDRLATAEIQEQEEEYAVYGVFTRDGYFKRISMQSIKGSNVQMLKENDEIFFEGEVSSNSELLFFTDKAQVYKAKISEFENTKASALGTYVPAKLGFEDDEKIIFFAVEKDFEDRLLICFENGKCFILPMAVYQTKTNRKKLTGAFSDSSRVCKMMILQKGEEKELFLKTQNGRALYVKTSLIPQKASRSSIGVTVLSLKPGDRITQAEWVEDMQSVPDAKYRKTKIPSPGSFYNEIDMEKNQITLI